MATPQHKLEFTEEQYLEYERHAEERHEFVDGHIYLMAGESDEHGDISANLTALIVLQLRGTSCRARVKDTKVRSGPLPFLTHNKRGLYSYPDLVVICGEPIHLDDHRDVITNPKVIIEVLSDSTKDFDRQEKFARYRQWNPTLTDYILVSQEQPFIEHFELSKKGDWVYHTYVGVETKMTIKSIRCTLSLADVYERVKFQMPRAAKARLFLVPAKKSSRSKSKQKK